MQDLSWTERQRECVEFPGPQLLISGPPGTGKTLVLLKRACRFSQAMPSAQILVFTFNKTLAQYARTQLRLNGAGPRADAVTFHSWAYRQLRSLGYRLRVITTLDRQRLLRRVVDDVLANTVETLPIMKAGAGAATTTTGTGTPLTLHARPLDWWSDEVDWIKSRALADWDSYREIFRTGRGHGLRASARQVVWQVYEGYQQQLAARGLVDYRDFALLLLRLGDSGDTGDMGKRLPDALRVSHVLIDEAQDLCYAELKVLTQLARQSLTIVADRTQKIYHTAFAWRDLGFDVRGGGRAKLLTKSYRTTRQVALLAACLRQLDPQVHSGDPDDVQRGAGELPDREGPVPVLVVTRDAAQEADLVLRLIAHLQATRPQHTIGVLARTWETLHRLEPALRARQVPYAYVRENEGDVASPGVKLTTFHSAKGLEFDDIILVGLSEGLFPPPLGQIIDSTDGEDGEEGEHEDEVLSTERRLLYVALTRTRRALYLLHGTQPTRFLAELDPTLYSRTAPEIAIEMTGTGETASELVAVPFPSIS